MIGGKDLNSYLVNYDPSSWATQVNNQLQAALQQALPYAEQYTQKAINQVQGSDAKAQQQIQSGFQQAQALDAPKHLATYNALDAYQQMLGLPTPVGGSFQLAQGMNNSLFGQPVSPQQAQQAAGYRQGVQQGGLFGGNQ